MADPVRRSEERALAIADERAPLRSFAFSAWASAAAFSFPEQMRATLEFVGEGVAHCTALVKAHLHRPR
jgi:hypothetical protein